MSESPTKVVGVCPCGKHMFLFERIARLRDPKSDKTVRMHELCFNRMVLEAREDAARKKDNLIIKPTAAEVPALMKGRNY